MKVVLVHNPSAGDEGVSGRRLTELGIAAGHTVIYQSTKDPDWRAALRGYADLYVAAGGDGTIRKVIIQLSGSDALVGLIPLGTANNIARTLDVPIGDPEAIIDGWSAVGPNQACRFDVPLLEYGARQRRFVESFGGGLFADLLVAADAAKADGSITGGLVDAWNLLSDLLDAPPPERSWSLSLDEQDLSGVYVGVEAMNVGAVGPRIGLAGSADPGDGLIDVVTIARRDLGELARHLRSSDAAHTADRELCGLSVHRGRRLNVGVPAATALHLDDRSWRSREELTDGAGIEVKADGVSVRVLAGRTTSAVTTPGL